MDLYSDYYFSVSYYYVSSLFLIHCVRCCSLANLAVAPIYSLYSLLLAAGAHFASAQTIGAISEWET